ncbi:MAG TPA: DUF721 domain-containing protein [Lacipirellulaceae bacterium]|jgi:hypothetical protein
MRDVPEASTDFTARRQREERRFYGRRPKKIADVVAQLITQRGYGRIDANEQFAAAWSAAAGETLAKFSRAGKLRRGQLEVWVANSTMMQEFGFEKARILAALQREMPDAKIRDLRFKVGQIN